jgi:hypothetical protein
MRSAILKNMNAACLQASDVPIVCKMIRYTNSHKTMLHREQHPDRGRTASHDGLDDVLG